VFKKVVCENGVPTCVCMLASLAMKLSQEKRDESTV